MEVDGDPDDILAFALASGKTWKQAGEAAGLGNTTIHRRLKEPAFRQRMREFRKEMVSEALGRGTAALTDSFQVLYDVAISSPLDAVRVSASKALIEMVVKLRSIEDLQAQIDEMRAELNDLRGGDTGTTGGDSPEAS